MKSLYIELSLKCNLACVFCSVGERENYRNLDEVKQILDKFVGQDYGKIMLTGGEPLMYDHLEAVIEYARDKYPELSMQTNGTLLSKKKAASLKKAGLQHLVISIHSHLPEIEDEVMNGKAVLNAQLEGLRNALDVGINVDVTIVISKGNYKTMPGFFKYMIENFPKVHHYTLNFVDAVGRAKMNKAVVPKVSEIELSLAEALLILKTANKSFRVERIPLCYNIGFAENSTELRRIVTKEPATFYRNSNRKAFDDKYFEREYVRADACKVCGLNSVCPGIKNDYAKLYGTREAYPIFIDPMPIVKRAGRD